MAISRKRKTPLYCSFCRKSDKAVSKLIAGPGVYICDACVGLCSRILDGKPTPDFAGWDSLSDRELLYTLGPASAALRSVDSVLREHVRSLRDRGVTWDRIGKSLGVSRQAVWQRFGEY